MRHGSSVLPFYTVASSSLKPPGLKKEATTAAPKTLPASCRLTPAQDGTARIFPISFIYLLFIAGTTHIDQHVNFTIYVNVLALSITARFYLKNTKSLLTQQQKLPAKSACCELK